MLLKLERHIIESLPNKPYCVDNLGNKMLILPKMQAINKKFLQYNHANLSSLIYDIDRAVNPIDIKNDTSIPTPNVLSINKESGHAHYFYFLERPVYQANLEQMQSKAYQFAARVDVGLTMKLDADHGYSKLLAKNVYNSYWLNIWIHENMFDLETLADFCNKFYLDMRRKILPVGLGRNCSLFESTRKFAYQEFRKNNFESNNLFEENIKIFAEYENSNFTSPLPQSEIRSTVKSVIKFCKRKMDKKGFDNWSAARRLKSIKTRRNNATNKKINIEIYRAKNPNASVREIAEATKIPRTTVHRLLSHL